MHRLIAIVSVFVLCPQLAWGWGPNGHSIVAELAQRRLTKAAAEHLEALIGRASLASLASWADDYKFTPAGAKTKRWHYVDIDLAADYYSPVNDCASKPEGDCLVAALDREIAMLADPAASLAERQYALRFVVHLIGDLTQPFHCAEHAKDGGGNAVQVMFTGKGVDGKPMALATNLHVVWDETLINAHAYGWGNYLDEIEAGIIPGLPVPQFKPGVIGEWANACHQAAKTAYALLPPGWEASVANHEVLTLDSAYQDQAQPLIARQLAIGGLELAAVLNAALEHR